mmetsp:Transcript_1647/g.5083  ORF Transcript_1647/g.5083 Transcript_1647/m.5083 type:complete len:266 (-) Transcript_1647:317-1114(-)
MAELKGSPSSGGSTNNGAARSTTEETPFSAVATRSFTKGRDSSKSLLSCSSAFFCCSLASAAFVVAWILVSWALTLLSSAVTPPWRVLTLGDSLDSSWTELAPAAPPFLASAMSLVMEVCSSMRDFCWVCSNSTASFRVASLGSPVRDSFAFPINSAVAVSAAATWPVARWTRSDSVAVSAAAAGAELPPGFGTVTPFAGVSLLPLPWGSQKRMPGSALAASQGIFQPRRGGLSPWELARAQTWAPPSWSPNHHPPKSGPSRVSQ